MPAMKCRLRVLLWSLSCLSVVATATPAGDHRTLQHQRIASEQQMAGQRLSAALAVCAGHFAATACEDVARAEHRSVSERLQRERQLLDADQRKGRAAERMARIEAKMRALDAQQTAPARR